MRFERFAPRFAAQMMLATARRNGEPELHVLPGLASHKRLSIDIGANWGPYTGALLPVSRAVIAFEPNPVMAAKLRRSFPDAQVENCALGATKGSATLKIPLQANGKPSTGWATLSDDRAFERSESVEVPVRRLDDFGFHGVGLIKIDVEGFEMQVLDGGWETIARERPNMMIECDQPAALVERLATLGYSAGYWHDGEVRPFDTWRADLVGWYGGPPNNFLFRKAA
jgi:FkbM family methyltransferase